MDAGFERNLNPVAPRANTGSGAFIAAIVVVGVAVTVDDTTKPALSSVPGTTVSGGPTVDGAIASRLDALRVSDSPLLAEMAGVNRNESAEDGWEGGFGVRSSVVVSEDKFDTGRKAADSASLSLLDETSGRVDDDVGFDSVGGECWPEPVRTSNAGVSV